MSLFLIVTDETGYVRACVDANNLPDITEKFLKTFLPKGWTVQAKPVVTASRLHEWLKKKGLAR